MARGVGTLWGTAPATGSHVDGAPVRSLEKDLLVLRRPGPHLQDERLDARLPLTLRNERPTFVFPSIHRSERGDRCLTVHPLGNPGPRADLGGRPRTLVPTDPRRMAAVLRELADRAGEAGLPATFEATHHGPELGLPAFFVEVAVTGDAEPSAEEVKLLAGALRSAVPDARDRVALAVGGGHYAPRFTDLACRRRWAFGHILSRYVLEDLDPTTARTAMDLTPGSEGVVLARAQDRDHRALDGLGPILPETGAPYRDERSPSATSTNPRTSGT